MPRPCPVGYSSARVWHAHVLVCVYLCALLGVQMPVPQCACEGVCGAVCLCTCSSVSQRVGALCVRLFVCRWTCLESAGKSFCVHQ